MNDSFHELRLLLARSTMGDDEMTAIVALLEIIQQQHALLLAVEDRLKKVEQR